MENKRKELKTSAVWSVTCLVVASALAWWVGDAPEGSFAEELLGFYLLFAVLGLYGICRALYLLGDTVS